MRHRSWLRQPAADASVFNKVHDNRYDLNGNRVNELMRGHDTTGEVPDDLLLAKVFNAMGIDTHDVLEAPILHDSESAV